MFDESEPLGLSSGAQMGGAAVLDEGASIVLVAHSRRRIKKKAAHTPGVKGSVAKANPFSSDSSSCVSFANKRTP